MVDRQNKSFLFDAIYFWLSIIAEKRGEVITTLSSNAFIFETYFFCLFFYLFLVYFVFDCYFGGYRNNCCKFFQNCRSMYLKSSNSSSKLKKQVGFQILIEITSIKFYIQILFCSSKLQRNFDDFDERMGEYRRFPPKKYLRLFCLNNRNIL